MKYQIVRGNSNEKDWVISFGDFCFNFYGLHAGFSYIMPKLYGSNVDTMKYHFILKDDDCYVGLAGVFPHRYQVFDDKLNYAGIGTVCVHPKYRNQGCMTYLLNKVNKELVKEQYDFAFLGGSETRYAHFGFYPCVEANIYEWTQHAQDRSYEFKLLQDKDIADIEQCYQLYTKRKIRCNRTLETFYNIATTWKNKIYSCYMNHNWIGYFIYSKKHQAITEIELSDISLLNVVISNFLTWLDQDTINIELPLYDEKNGILAKNAKYVSKRTVELFQILSYERVLSVLLQGQIKLRKLIDGQLTVQVEDSSPFTCIVADDQVKILKNTNIPIDIHLTKKEAHLLFLGDYPYDKLPLKIREICRDWFPLPLFISSSDQV